jgi:hypothetical protein
MDEYTPNPLECTVDICKDVYDIHIDNMTVYQDWDDGMYCRPLSSFRGQLEFTTKINEFH